ncbi:MAG: helix-turn-helix transcriptional regulator [Acidimicrobiales bacterium]
MSIIETRIQTALSAGLKRVMAAENLRQLDLANLVRGYPDLSPATVSRWINHKTLASREHALAVADTWPEHVDGAELEALYDELAVAPDWHAADAPEEAYRHVVEALEEHRTPDRLLFAAVHALAGVDAGGAAVDEGQDPHLGPELRSWLDRFDAALDERARRGCDMRILFTVDSQYRYEARIRPTIYDMGGANVQVRAFPAPAMPVISLLVIDDADVGLAIDHGRWYRAQQSVFVSAPGPTRWSTEYFRQLWDEAPYRLRTKSGVNERAVRRMEADLGLEDETAAEVV